MTACPGLCQLPLYIQSRQVDPRLLVYAIVFSYGCLMSVKMEEMNKDETKDLHLDHGAIPSSQGANAPVGRPKPGFRPRNRRQASSLLALLFPSGEGCGKLKGDHTNVERVERQVKSNIFLGHDEGRGLKKKYGACKSITLAVRSSWVGPRGQGDPPYPIQHNTAPFAAKHHSPRPPHVCSQSSDSTIHTTSPPPVRSIFSPFSRVPHWHPMAVKDQHDHALALVRPQPSSCTVTLVSRRPPAPPPQAPFTGAVDQHLVIASASCCLNVR
jgi:hypothetical protein